MQRTNEKEIELNVESFEEYLARKRRTWPWPVEGCTVPMPGYKPDNLFAEMRKATEKQVEELLREEKPRQPRF